MAGLAAFLIPVLMAAVLVVLIAGIVNFARRDHSPRTSNKLMRWRVMLQAAAIVVLLIVMLLVGR